MKTPLQLVTSNDTADVRSTTSYRETGLTWSPTELLGSDSGFRLDLGLNKSGDICAFRVVPLGELRSIPPDILDVALRELDDWHVLEVEVAIPAMAQQPVVPDELQARLDDLHTRFGSKRRPNADSVHLAEYHQLVLDVEAWAYNKALRPTDAISRALDVSPSTAVRWRRQARRWGSDQGIPNQVPADI